MRNFLSVKFVQMFLVTLVATLTIAEVVASIAVKTVLTTINGLLTSVTHKPSIKVSDRFLLLFNLFTNLLFYRFCNLSFILLSDCIIISLLFRSRFVFLIIIL